MLINVLKYDVIRDHPTCGAEIPPRPKMTPPVTLYEDQDTPSVPCVKERPLTLRITLLTAW